MKDIVSSPTNIANNFYTKDTVVIWRGTCDIGRNESNHALREIKNFVQAHSKTNIIVISAPCQYDLSQTSCVNKEVKVFSRKLCKYLKIYNYTLIVEVDSNRDYYTCHGLQLNKKGKEQIARKIASAIQDKLNIKKSAPIAMSHKPLTDAITITDQANTTITYHKDKKHEHINSTPTHHNNSKVRASLRHKKPPDH